MMFSPPLGATTDKTAEDEPVRVSHFSIIPFFLPRITTPFSVGDHRSLEADSALPLVVI